MEHAMLNKKKDKNIEGYFLNSDEGIDRHFEKNEKYNKRIEWCMIATICSIGLFSPVTIPLIKHYTKKITTI